ncbi:MAG: four helix bundle protein [Acidobacteria bacterium]|nr:four helix bundle protein [Acidobacteriota bacterium]MBI3428029.1 four helix bundle protein [Acidobacteriota bacterium]
MNDQVAAKTNKSRSFQDLDVWKKAHAWVLGIYRMTETFPKHELFGLTSQLRRAAVSVPANIAEGFRKKGPADKARFYNIAQGSLEECRYYLILAKDLGYADTRQLAADLDEIGRLLDAYMRSMLAANQC